MEQTLSEQTTLFKSLADVVAYVRQSLRLAGPGRTPGHYSVGTSPINSAERNQNALQTVFVRWTGPSYSEVKNYLDNLHVNLHAGRGPVRFVLTRNVLPRP